MAAPSFKDCIADDLSTFLSKLEFADRHTIDGKEMTVLVDENELLERGKSKLMVAPMDGLYTSKRLIYVSKLELGTRPVQGRILKLDGKPFRVKDCTEEAGVLAIEIEAVKS